MYSICLGAKRDFFVFVLNLEVIAFTHLNYGGSEVIIVCRPISYTIQDKSCIENSGCLKDNQRIFQAAYCHAKL